MNDRLNEKRLSLVEKLSRIFLETQQNNQELIEVLQASEKQDLLDKMIRISAPSW